MGGGRHARDNLDSIDQGNGIEGIEREEKEIAADCFVPESLESQYQFHTCPRILRSFLTVRTFLTPP